MDDTHIRNKDNKSGMISCVSPLTRQVTMSHACWKLAKWANRHCQCMYHTDVFFLERSDVQTMVAVYGWLTMLKGKFAMSNNFKTPRCAKLITHMNVRWIIHQTSARKGVMRYPGKSMQRTRCCRPSLPWRTSANCCSADRSTSCRNTMGSPNPLLCDTEGNNKKVLATIASTVSHWANMQRQTFSNLCFE